eukprot:710981-Amphidinium_carterae.1
MPHRSSPRFTRRAALDDLGNGAGTPSTRIIRDNTPEPDQTRPPEFAPSFKLHSSGIIRSEGEAIGTSDS